MYAVEYIIDEYGNLTTKSGIDNKVQEIEVEKMNKGFIPYETMKEKTESILPKEERQKLVEKYVNDYSNTKSSEALDGLFDLVTCQGSFEKAQKYYNVLEEAITELQAIKEANPSEALENIIQALNHTVELSNKARHILNEEPVSVNWNEVSEIQVIKQTILKVQEQEKELAKYKKLEEQMGCSFAIIDRAIKEGIWSTEYWYCEKEENQDKIKHIFPKITILENEWGFDCGDHCYYFVLLKDYQKTWWFKEDKSE